MKIKQMTKWCWDNSWITLPILNGVLFLVNGISVVAQVIYGEGEYSSGNDISFSVAAFVIGCVLFSSSLRFGITNSVSRRSVFLGNTLHALLFSLSCTISGAVLMLFMEWMPGQGVSSIFHMFYMNYHAAVGGLASGLTMMLWNLVTVLSAIMIGYFVGGVFHRLGKLGKILWAAGLPVSVFAVLPILIGLLPPTLRTRLIESALELFSFLGTSPFYGILLFALVSVVFWGVNWILLRRAAI